MRSYYTGSRGIFYIQPHGAPSPFPVYCSFKEIRARTYIQRHYGTGLEFNQTWIRYRDGFGDMFSTAEQFWLGNQYIHYITYYSLTYTLVFEMGNQDRNEVRQQEYNEFVVWGDESDFMFYYLNTPSIPLSGLPALGDCLFYVHGSPFSTFDNVNGIGSYECANVHGSGWWFDFSPSNCGYCNPNCVLVQSNDGRRTGVDNEVFWTTDMADWSPWYTEMWLEARGEV